MKANYLVMEMVNFIGHFQYYIASEVVKVSWRKFRSELEKMESLEKVLQAHNEFLDSMQSSCMLNTKVNYLYFMVNLFNILLKYRFLFVAGLSSGHHDVAHTFVAGLCSRISSYS